MIAAPPSYGVYEANVLHFVQARFAEGRDVLFASQPYIGEPAHLEQQTRVRQALAPFSAKPQFRYLDNLYLSGGKWDAVWFSQMMWLNPRGNRRLAEVMAQPIGDLIEVRLRKRAARKVANSGD